MEFNDQLKRHALTQIGAALADVAPHADDTSETLYERAVEAIRRRSRLAYTVLLAHWETDFRIMAGNYCSVRNGKHALPSWEIRPTNAAEQAESASRCLPWLSWIRHEPVPA